MAAPDMTTLERAFELAKSGEVASVLELTKRLKAEGYPAHTITGPTLRRQLLMLIRHARQRSARDETSG